MNDGEGAARRHADYMLATGQWTTHGAGKAPLSAEDAQRLRECRERAAQEAAAADAAFRGRFLAAMAADGNPGSVVMPLAGPDVRRNGTIARGGTIAGEVRCWRLGSTQESAPSEVGYTSVDWYFDVYGKTYKQNYTHIYNVFERSRTVATLTPGSPFYQPGAPQGQRQEFTLPPLLIEISNKQGISVDREAPEYTAAERKLMQEREANIAAAANAPLTRRQRKQMVRELREYRDRKNYGPAGRPKKKKPWWR